ncbi:HDOD domain-containing protein [Curvibacter sp. HBC61]|uniref:HDOD domain-containing protein n=1 Tax=Curvibacter cyanobacteriorum TaxID=3026422 RepID=A0ABT5MXK3_9BURK|nr:HDOD domain-containing protein [Curvibacter sp. HBC61]MDD0837532.1 HDOD domain-containing protein [Curvibacter sp. HBC61]
MELQALLAHETALPSIPRVVALLMHELDQEEPDLRKVSQLISTDPALTARLLQLANSAFFQLSRRINGVAEALALLGLNHVRTLVSAAAVGGAFRTVTGINLQQFWRYSLDTAKVSRTLASVVRQNPSAAFTAGLVHAVGELVMHIGMPREMALLNMEHPPLDLKRAKTERRHLGYCYAQVSAGFARQWQFPPAIVDALEYQIAPFDNDVYEPLAGVIHLAAWRIRAKEAGFTERELAVSFPDTVGLALELDIDMVLQQDPIDWTSAHEVGAFS